MQLDPPGRPKSIRGRLGAAACALLASGSAAPGHAADTGATNQLDLETLLYGEARRVDVFEPTGRFTRSYADGESLFGQVGVDVITGASPTGEVPSGTSQTITTASGHLKQTSPSQIPTSQFSDVRFAIDGGWTRPFWLLTPTLDLHFSREKDYQSLGVTGTVAIDLPDHLTTFTAGGGYNGDDVFPVGGVTDGLVSPTRTGVPRPNNKTKWVASGLVGVSRVLTRRWLVGLTGSYTSEQGYLTEPYKLLSVIDGTSGMPVSSLTEKRPSSRTRTSILASSVYDFDRDVLYLTYRYYWDDWNVHSHTIDAKYRYELGGDTFLEPHIRFYDQSAASFFRYGLIDTEPLPNFATSDYRLGNLKSLTLGATLGFRLSGIKGEWSVRAEYLGQFADSHPSGVVGIERQYDLYPTLNIGSLLLGYSIQF